MVGGLLGGDQLGWSRGWARSSTGMRRGRALKGAKRVEVELWW
jgi:hypothetical protein